MHPIDIYKVHRYSLIMHFIELYIMFIVIDCITFIYGILLILDYITFIDCILLVTEIN